MPIHDWTRVDAGIFHHFHSYWVGEIARALNAGRLPSNCYALAEQIAGEIGPDVLTLQLTASEGDLPNGTSVPAPANGSGTANGSAPVAIAVAPPRVQLSGRIEESIRPRKQRKPRSVVIHHISDHRIVAIVEVLSPGNKSSRDALRACLKKAVSVLRGGCHLLIIDLFPPGPRDPQGIHGAFWREFAEQPDFTLPPDKPLTLAAYSGGDEKRYYVAFAAAGEALPDMPLFLDPEHYVPVPLESAYRAAWDAVPQFWRARLERGQS